MEEVKALILTTQLNSQVHGFTVCWVNQEDEVVWTVNSGLLLAGGGHGMKTCASGR